MLIGTPSPAFGGSVIAEVTGARAKGLPETDFAAFAAACTMVRESFADGVVLSARDISDGGVAAALAEMTFAALEERGVGFWLDDAACGAHAFSEAPGFVLEVDRAVLPQALRAAARAGAHARKIGETIPQPEAVFGVDRDPGGNNQRILLSTLRDAWEAPLRNFYA